MINDEWIMKENERIMNEPRTNDKCNNNEWWMNCEWKICCIIFHRKPLTHTAVAKYKFQTVKFKFNSQCAAHISPRNII